MEDFDGQPAHAIWYPQMGGYVGKAVVVTPPNNGACFEVYVWHDGQFPFNEGNNLNGCNPAHLHHCLAEQFVRFGRKVLELQDVKPEDE